MTAIPEQRQLFTFPRSWLVIKYDDSNHHATKMASWSFRVQLAKATSTAQAQWSPSPLGQKAVDFVAWEPGTRDLKLIEVKDYRIGVNNVPSELPETFARKVRDTLAGLALASTDPASDAHNVALGLQVGATLSVWLDVEWPVQAGSSLAPSPAQVRASLLQQVQVVMRPFGARVYVADRSPATPWTVKDYP